VELPVNETWRAPRLRVLAAGVPVARATEASVIASGGYCADFFQVRAALAGDAAEWSAITDLAIDVQMALDADVGFVSMVQGYADAIGIDPITGTLTIEGRDYAAQLIEARTQETFANQTASEIATILALRHGLLPDVQPTFTPAGRYWELEFDSLTLATGVRATTEWDLLATLAGWEGFDLWVSGQVLHFRPPQISVPMPVLGVSDFSALRLERALAFAGDISVVVKSWHSRAGTGTTQTAATARGGPRTQDYLFVVPNLTPDAAQLLADRRLAEIAAHERLLRAEMPGELTLMPRAYFTLAGTGTLYDGIWRIEEVERRMSVREGFSQTLRANSSLPL
jgi:hypothetical protein